MNQAENIIPSIATDIPISRNLIACMKHAFRHVVGQFVDGLCKIFFMRISSNVFIQCCRSSASPRQRKSAESFQNPSVMNLLNLNWNDVQSQFITILRQGRFIIMRRGEEGTSHETKTTTASFVIEPAFQGAITNMLGLLLQDDEKNPVLTMMLSDEPNQLLRWQTPLPQSETSSGRLTAWRDPKIVGDILCCVNAKGITTMSIIFDWNFQVYPSLSGSNA